MSYRFSKNIIGFFLAMTLVGCGTNFAPIMELKWNSPFRSKTHTVKRGDTLFSIAFRYDTNYHTLAAINHINPPYYLRIGQVINLQNSTSRPRPVSPAKTYYRPSPAKPAVIHSPANRFARSFSGWMWPVSGQVVTTFVPEQGKKGINIACKRGEKVIAAAAGTVAYAGSGLAGYGNLVIIKHSLGYLTAYGNNSQIMVSEGQQVRAGQVIAQVGIVDRKYNGVHFEIRKSGIPVNPLNYLQKG